MEFHLLVDVELFSQFDQNTINGIEVVTVVSSRCREVQDYQVVVFLYAFQRLMVLKPFYKQSLFAYPSVRLDHQWLVLLAWDVHIEPLLDHEIVFLETSAGLIFVETEHNIRGAELWKDYSM